MTSICLFPVATDSVEVTDLLSRCAWFLAGSASDRIYLPVASDSLAAEPWRVAPGMDEAVAARFEALREKLKFVVATSVEQLATPMSHSTVILRWRKDMRPRFVSAQQLASWEKGKKVFQVDPVAIRQEGSYYIEALQQLQRDRPALVEECRQKFEKFAERLGQFERAYVLATGPSVSSYGNFDYANSLGIVCNSVILDEELMRAVRPRIIAFADPIFHFGPSQYAGAFRAKLRESVERHDLAICIPFKYYALFVSVMPDLRERTIAIPFAKDRAFNFNLRSDFTLKTTANILTFLMVPLAATFAREVHVIGCDGRPLKEDTYFWNHNPSTQINDKMANIREVHPGFFAIDYNDYYLEHCDTLERQLREGEASGLRFVSIGFSHIPALRSRSGRGQRLGMDGVACGSAKDVVIVDPDATGWSGHYMAYNDKLAAALEGQGCTVRVLCQRKIDPAILAERPAFVPVLDTHSWSVGMSKAPEHFARVFGDEIETAVARLTIDNSATLFYLYTGSLEHARGLARLTQRWSTVFVHVNLFYLSFRDMKDEQWIRAWKSFFEWIDTAGPRFVVTVPTREVQSDVLETFGVILDVAPHPSTGVADEQLGVLPPPRREGLPLNVTFPGAPRAEKGYNDTVECVRLLGDELGFRTWIRHAPGPGTPAEMLEPPTGLPPNATVVCGALSNEEFERFFRRGDVVVLPYTPDAFAKRTSGLLIDALHFGLPAVVVEGTWLANVVRRHHCGVVVADATPANLCAGVMQIAADIEGFRARARTAAADYFQINTWRALACFVLRPLNTSQLQTPRLLCIDLTGFDGVSATGRVKEAFFLGWPAERYLLASFDSASRHMRLSGLGGEEVLAPSDQSVLVERIREFSPDLIYYRAVDNMVVHTFARKAIDALQVPYVVHLMDDWPERLRRESCAEYPAYDFDLRSLLAGARACLTISDAMSSVFEARYGRSFVPFANAVDPAAFPPHPLKAITGDGLRILYTGALADDMTFQSVKDVAAVLPTLAGGLVVLEVYTREPWFDRARRAFAGNLRVRIHKQVPAEDYYSLLQSADVLLVAYNFDAATKAYVGLSRANKLPEYLAAGCPVLAYGPPGISSIDELTQSGAAAVVSRRDDVALAATICELRDSIARRRELVKHARAAAFPANDVWRVSRAFRESLLRLAMAGTGRARGAALPAQCQAAAAALVGPFERSSAAHWDETDAIATLFAGTLKGSVMIDVGAHHGSSLVPFLRRGWKVIAFEPDEKNREALVENLQSNRLEGRVEIDIRAVSNATRSGLPFYRSTQSTGISGLSAFHETHEYKQTVDVVSLSDALADQPIANVDFLKIDTEGHDLQVLQGFPWQRFKPKVIECEFEDSKTIPLGYRFDDLAGFLVERGYAVYVSEWHPIVRYGIRHDWRRLVRYPCSLADGDGWGNLLAFREPVDEARLIAAVHARLRLAGGQATLPSAPAVDAIAYPSPAASSDAAMLPLHSLLVDQRLNQRSRDVWAIATPGGGEAGTFWRALFQAGSKIADRTICGSIRLQANQTVEVRVALCRHGNQPYEGTQCQVRLQAGAPQVVRLQHRFANEHAQVRLQVEFREVVQGLELTVAEPFVHHRLEGLLAGLENVSITLSQANRLFRQKNYTLAMAIYLSLAERIPLRMYRDNALACAGRLGLSSVCDESELRRRLM